MEPKKSDQSDQNKRVIKDVKVVKILEKVHSPDFNDKHFHRSGVNHVLREDLRLEVDDGRCADQEKLQVENEGVQERAALSHWVDFYEE